MKVGVNNTFMDSGDLQLKEYRDSTAGALETEDDDYTDGFDLN
jgi:hypothetical protein